MNIELRCPEDLDVLEKLHRRERNARQRDRYHAVWLALNGKTAPQIAARLDRSRRFVQQWAYRYRDAGLTNLTEQHREEIQQSLEKPDTMVYQCGLKSMEVGVLQVIDKIGGRMGQPDLSKRLKAEGRMLLEVY